MFTSGGSTSLSKASKNTKIEITVRNSPLTKPDKYSTRPYLERVKDFKEMKSWMDTELPSLL